MSKGIKLEVVKRTRCPKFDVYGTVSGRGRIWHRICARDVHTPDKAWERFKSAYAGHTCTDRHVAQVKHG